MDQNLIQNAVSTFCVVPEIYQQAFQQLGAEFPDELVQAVKAKPEEAVKMVQQNEDLLKGIVTIYQQYGDQINKAASQAQQETGMFRKGGKLDYLVSKNQMGGYLRNRGRLNAYRGNTDYTADSTWTYMNGADIKNFFNGNTLEQHVVTPGEYGVPRRVVRTITNYDIPAKADTTYMDAQGNVGARNPGFLDKLLGNTHSLKFIQSVDDRLVGAEPMQLSGREVKATETKKKK